MNTGPPTRPYQTLSPSLSLSPSPSPRAHTRVGLLGRVESGQHYSLFTKLASLDPREALLVVAEWKDGSNLPGYNPERAESRGAVWEEEGTREQEEKQD